MTSSTLGRGYMTTKINKIALGLCKVFFEEEELKVDATQPKQDGCFKIYNCTNC